MTTSLVIHPLHGSIRRIHPARMAHAARAVLGRCVSLYRDYRRTRRLTGELYALDDRSLRDLGLDRSEIGSVVAEVTHRAHRTRIQSGAVR